MATGAHFDIAPGPLGVDARHGPEFCIDRPHGSGTWLLLHFPTPMRIRDRHGEQRTRADACILHSPRHAQHFRGLNGGMANHYVHLRSQGLSTLVAQLGIPTDTVLYPRPVGFIAEHIAELLRERMRDDAQAGIIFAALAVRLLATLSRNLEPPANATTLRLRTVQERMGDVRARMREEPGHRWSVAGMARIVGLSPSRFRALWRRFHGTSPQEDLTSARIARACHLLTAAPAPVAEIARSCGFADPFYFSRVFRRRTGCVPSAYYREACRGRLRAGEPPARAGGRPRSPQPGRAGRAIRIPGVGMPK